VLAELPQCTLINGYGPTENTTFTCCYPVPHDWAGDTSVPIGAPIANTRVYVLDAHGAPVPVGVPGELYAGGDGVALGYLGRDELTAARFVAYSFATGRPATAPGPRLYRTGDRVRWRTDGTLEFLGRLDQQVKIRGFRVEPGEVEAILASHPGVQDAAVVALTIDAGQPRLVAYYVARPSGGAAGVATAPLSSSALRSYLRERLPDYMVPATFVALASLPIGATRKVDRRALPLPRLDEAESERTFTPPRSDTERRLAAIWAEVLGREHVGVETNFFDAGGHSLTAMRIMSRVQETFGVRLPLTAVFERPTLEQSARLLDELASRVDAPAASGPSIGRVARAAHRREPVMPRVKDGVE
jgi:acyl carrier protein